MIYNNFTITDCLDGHAFNQSDLFTPAHEKFNLTVKIKNNRTGEKYTRNTFYQYAPKYTTFKKGDGILALVCDALSYSSTRDFDDFMNEFGYEDRQKAAQAFHSCKKSYNFFISAGLQEEDLSALQDRLDK